MSVKKPKYAQKCKVDYFSDFPFLKKSKTDDHHVYCVSCCTDINIGHGGRGDIIQHIETKKHKNSVAAVAKNEKISNFFVKNNDDMAVIRAECLFTAFIIEHNLPISCADHIAPLLRKAFPGNEIAKKYSCARTKTTAIMSQFAANGRERLVNILQNQPFCVSTDGSNDSDAKIFPIVVTYFDNEREKIENSLLALPVLKGDCSVYFTIDDIVNIAGYGRFQKFLTFLAGLGWLADAFEIIILSVIGDMLACHWTMTRWQNALLTSSVFLGMAIGAPIFGNFADRYGRKTSLAISMLLLFIFGASSAASPNYTWIIVLRAFMGFSLGGIAQGVTLCCEYYPAKVRGRAGFFLSYYWALGAIGVVCAAWLVMAHTNDWRIFVFIASVPALIVFLSMKWYPESARYYLVSNQSEKAMATLRRLIKMNRKEMPEGKLVEMNATEETGKITDLLRPKMRRATLLFWYIWLAVSMCYYGVALITPIIVTQGSLLRASRNKNSTSFMEDFTSEMPCTVFSNENYRDMLWTTAAEFPGLLVFTFVVECCARKVFLGTTCFITAFLMLFLMLEIKPEAAIFVVLFIIRALIAGVFQLLFIMTSEAFPTTLRASAMGTGSGCARVGGLLIPYLAQVTIIAKPIPSIFVLAGIATLAGLAALLLPMETRGKHMNEIVGD